jgi:hypothetical protein
MDYHHAANIADSFTHHVGTTFGTSFKRGRPFGLWDATNLKSLCGNWLLHWFTHHAAPFDKGRVPGLWHSMVGPSQ